MKSADLQRLFPEWLLEADIKTRLDWFDAQIIPHARFQKLLDDILFFLEFPAGQDIMMVIGPAGVGKTALLNTVFNLLVLKYVDELASNPWWIYVVKMLAVTPGSGVFDWTDFIKRFFIEIGEPLISKKIANVISKISVGPNGETTLKHTTAKPDWLLVFEETLRNRFVRWLLVDEAQDMAKMASGRKTVTQMDAVKSLENQTNTMYILFGTYDLLNLSDLSGQLTRRTRKLHFSRYDIQKSPEDLKEWQKIINNFEGMLPTRKRPVLVKHHKVLWGLSLGDVGNLKNLLLGALALAEVRNLGTVTIQECLDSAKPHDELEIMFQETIEGEARFAKSIKAKARLEEAMGIKLDVDDSKSQTPSQPPKGKPKSPPRLRKRVGQRKPKRDSTSGRASPTQGSN